MAGFVATVIEEIKDHLTAAANAVERVDRSGGKNVEVENAVRDLRTELDGVRDKLERALIGATPVDAPSSQQPTSGQADTTGETSS